MNGQTETITVDVTDLQLILGQIDLYLPGKSYQETARELFDSLRPLSGQS